MKMAIPQTYAGTNMDASLEMYFKNSEEFGWMEKTHALTRLFRKINLRSEQKRINGEKQRVYIIKRQEIQDLCERYKIITAEERPY